MNHHSSEMGSVAIAMRKQLDADLFREHFLLTPTIEVVLTTVDLQQLVNFCADQSVSLAIVDFEFPDRAGYRVGMNLLQAKKVQQLLLIDRHYHPMRAEQAQSAGAAYSSRNVKLHRLTKFAGWLSQGRSIAADELENLLEYENQWRIDRIHEEIKLTNREIEIWTLLGEGKTVADCAERLGIAPSTADNHKAKLMKKLNVNKSTELARLALRAGLVDL